MLYFVTRVHTQVTHYSHIVGAVFDTILLHRLRDWVGLGGTALNQLSSYYQKEFSKLLLTASVLSQLSAHVRSHKAQSLALFCSACIC